MQSKGKTILIADDEPDILEILSYNLRNDGYTVHTANDGEEALLKAPQVKPDLIILDVMMPKKTGMEVCRLLRLNPAFQQTLIIFLTALSDESSHLKGLEYGADDFISKPISTKILTSKVQALFRRLNQESDDKILDIQGLTIDPIQFTVMFNGKPIILAKKEFELLYLLASKKGKVFLRNEILSQIWGTEVIVGDRTIDVHIRKIRSKLGIDCITTVKGVGYKFEMP
ncbi:MAG: response regulator [Chitinophagaceae bacterium]|jgi:two-component system alkaline phosphatase synthesis response regulator PhoP